MNETICSNRGTRGDLLMAYLYGEGAPDERLAFDRHLASCALCRLELEALGGVRAALEQWTPPERSFAATAPEWPVAPPQTKGVWASLQRLPAWAQVAAALVFLGVGAGLANLEVSYRADGLTIHTGWGHAVAAVGRTSMEAPAAAQGAAPGPAPWAADVAALRQQLQEALDARQAKVAAPAAAGATDAVLRRVQTLLQESEQRQQRELALRVAEIARDVQSQRQADLVRIDRSLGLMQSRTGMEVMRTQQQVNSLAQRVSQKP